MGLITPMAQKCAVGPYKASWALEDLVAVHMTLQFILHIRRVCPHAVKICDLDGAFDLLV